MDAPVSHQINRDFPFAVCRMPARRRRRVSGSIIVKSLWRKCKSVGQSWACEGAVRGFGRPFRLFDGLAARDLSAAEP